MQNNIAVMPKENRPAAMAKEKRNITLKMKKSALRAKDKYDYSKLVKAGDRFLPMTWEESKEEIVFSYDVGRAAPFSNIRNEGQVVTLNILIQAASLYSDSAVYAFSMNPNNVFYSTSGRICIKARDLAANSKMNQARFLLEYKALIGSTLASNYSYRDYIEGGEELFAKSSMTDPLTSARTIGDITDYLEKIKADYLQKQQDEKVYIEKKKYQITRIAVLVLFGLTLIFGVYSGFQLFKNVPYYKAVTAADNAYMENDNVGVIDALEKIDGEDLDPHQQFILASAYLQSESLTKEQKNNIAKRVTINSDEKELLYWIYLGRNQVDDAEDMAMQLSDDELLLYAYMKDKAGIEADKKMSGAEKATVLDEVQKKIDGLKEKYKEEEEQTTAPTTAPTTVPTTEQTTAPTTN